MRTTILTLLAATVSTAFGGTVTIMCTPTALTNSTVIGHAVYFVNGSGSGSFACSDSSLGAVTLNSESVSLYVDYDFGNGGAADPNDNSAGVTFSNSMTTWAAAHPGAFTSTMNLGTGVTGFAIGNLSSLATTYSNLTSGGLAGTSYVQPITDGVTGTLLDNFVINAGAFVDAGGFANGESSARVAVTFDYTPAGTPEPASLALAGAGLLAVGLIGRKRWTR